MIGFFADFGAVLLRALFGMLVGALVNKHFLSPEQGDHFTKEFATHAIVIVSTVLLFGWTLLSRFFWKLKVKLALGLPENSTEDDLKTVLPQGKSTKILGLFMALMLASFSMTACTPKVIKTGVSPVADVANAGAKIQDSAHLLFDAAVKADQKNLIPHQALIDTAIAVNKIGHLGLDLSQSLDAYNAAKASGKDLTQIKAAINQTLDALKSTLADVGVAIPPGKLEKVDEAIRTIIDLLALTKGGLI